MKISELTARQGNVALEFEVIEKGDVRDFEKFGKKGKVCNCVVSDDSGRVKLTLWNDDCDTLNVGDKAKIENGYVGEWQGELQLSTGKFGKIEVVSKTEPKTPDTPPNLEDAPASEDWPDEEKPIDDEENVE